MRRVTILGNALLAMAMAGHGQTAAPVHPVEPMPAYDVATIKPWDGKGFALPLRIYIQQAFDISPNAIGWVIGPDWLNTTKYVIQAKPPNSIRDAMQTMTPAQRSKEIHEMMRTLLADRFHLKAHFETREMPVYELVPAKGGSKLKVAADPGKSQFVVGDSLIRGNSCPIHTFIELLESVPDIGGRKVVDKTGLIGVYDFSLKWAPLQPAVTPGDQSGIMPAGRGDGVPLFTAIEEQLGLKLVSVHGPGQVLVIDHIEQPTEN